MVVATDRPNILILSGDDIGWYNIPMQALAAEQLQSFIEFPPRQKPAAFNLDTVLEQMEDATGGGLH